MYPVILTVITARRYTAVFNKPTVYNIVTFNTAVLFWYPYTSHPEAWLREKEASRDGGVGKSPEDAVSRTRLRKRYMTRPRPRATRHKITTRRQHKSWLELHH